jgi:hypothetical protein
MKNILCFGQKKTSKKASMGHESDDQDDDVEVGDG